MRASAAWSRRAAAPRALATLGDALAAELAIERDSLEMPAELSALMARLAPRWTVVDEPGRAIVALEHATNGARVEFDCRVDADADAVDDDDDDDDEPPRGGGGGGGGGGGDEDGDARPVPFEVHVGARGGARLIFDCVAADEAQIEKVSHFAPGSETDDDEAYAGPEFEELDPALQEAFDAHLERLGVDAELCSFICLFADHKEHREYVQWMEAVKRAVEE